MQKYIDFHTCPPVPLVVAHRGARGHAPENTLTAAALGYAVQADLWELDANYTKDGKLVVMHDDSRVAAGEIDADTLKSFDGLTVPTLEEALAFTKDNGWYVNVEIKNHSHLIGHETVTKDVLDLIRRLDMVEQVIISSFQHRYLEECRVLCPEMATGALVEHIRPRDPAALCRRLQVNAYHPDQRILAPGDLAALRDAGFAVNVWTVNDMSEAKRLVAEGATGIITDFPAACRKALGE